jgi:hypothetical protein
MSKQLPCFSVLGFSNLASAGSSRTARRARTMKAEPAHGAVSVSHMTSLRLQPLVYFDGETSRC